MKGILEKTIKRLRGCVEPEGGFTLIEIMIVVTIIAILGALVVPRFMDMPQKARVSAAKQQMRTFGLMLDKYYFEQGSYPTTEEGLNRLVTEKYLKKKEVPLDPWGAPYEYRSPGEYDSENEYEMWSYGADKKEGGEGFDADIKSWE